VDFPNQVWCLLTGHPLSSDWRDWCDGEGADQQRVRRSCEQILELPDASVLGLDFTAPVEQRGLQGEGVSPRGGGSRGGGGGGRSGKDRREAAKVKRVITRDMPLVKGGEKIPLTNANRDEYVLKWVRACLLQGAEEALLCMKAGLDRSVGPQLLLSLVPSHIRRYICGSPTVDLDELKACVTYDRGYNPGHRMIRMFWRCVEALSDAEQRQLLLFWTGSSVPPSAGFHEDGLRDQPVFSDGTLVISKLHDTAEGGPNRLPQATTCSKNLLLPEYPTAEVLKKKILDAITFSAQGFSHV
jgi:hypothetical protein